MARKSSVIMTTQEIKEVKNDLKQEIKETKILVKAAWQDVKNTTKTAEDLERKLSGLETRLATLEANK